MNRTTDNPLTAAEQFCLNGYLMTKDVDEAYLLSREKKTTATPDNIHRLALRWLRSKPCKEYLCKRRKLILSEVSNTSNDEAKPKKNYRDKDTLIDELTILAEASTNPKEKAQILGQIADLMQLKKEESKEDKELTHFYLPITCKRCSLYVEAKKKKETNNA